MMNITCPQSVYQLRDYSLCLIELNKGILNKFIPMTISNVMEFPVNGLWEVVFENNGKKGVLYIPYSKKHIIAGMVIEIATGIVDVRSMIL